MTHRTEKILKEDVYTLSDKYGVGSKVVIKYGELRAYMFIHDCTNKICLQFEYSDKIDDQKRLNLIKILQNFKIPDNASNI